MIIISKKQVETHFRILFKRLNQLKKHFELLAKWEKWARSKKIPLAGKVVSLFIDSLEGLAADLIDFQECYKEAERRTLKTGTRLKVIPCKK